jgi:hypothetical protein
LRSAVSLSMEYASAGSRSGAFVGVGGFWKGVRAEPNPPRLFDVEEEAFCGCGDPGHDVSMCRSTFQGFIRSRQIGQATRPSSGKSKLVL